jgi:pimeloyl-ACP methyl ester carboxylesterase
VKRLAMSALAIGGLGLAARRYRRDRAGAERRLSQPPVSPQRVQTSAGTVEFVDLGQGEPVLVLHGNGGGWDQSVDWVHRRLNRGFRSICPARFGYLGSTLPADADPARQADVLVELLDRLTLDRVAVVSLSAGSITAAHLAARHPDRVRLLLLESPVVPTRKPLRQPPVALFSALARSEVLFWLTSSLPALVATASGVAWKHLDAAGRSELREIMTTLTPVRPRADGMVFDNFVAYREIVADQVPWEGIAATTLVVTAADSPLPSPDDAARLVDRLPAGQLLQVPGGGHLLLGNVERLRSVVGDFLAVERWQVKSLVDPRVDSRRTCRDPRPTGDGAGDARDRTDRGHHRCRLAEAGDARCWRWSRSAKASAVEPVSAGLSGGAGQRRPRRPSEAVQTSAVDQLSVQVTPDSSAGKGLNP